MEAARLPWPALGMLLIRDGLVTSEELEEVLARQGDDREHRISSQRLGEALVANGTVTSAQVARLVAEQHELPFVDLDEPDSIVPVPVRLPEDVARLHCAMPIRAFPDGSVLVVVADPTRTGCFDDIRWALGVPVRFAVAAPDAIEAAIDAAAESTAPEEALAQAEGHENGRRPPLSDALVEVGPEDWPLSEPGIDARRMWPILGSLLLRDAVVTEDELEAALAQQRLSSTKRLGEILIARGNLTDEQLSRALAEQHELPFVELKDAEIDRAAASLLPRDVARAHLALPISRLDEGGLQVVVADPASAVHADELRATLGVPLQFAVAMPEDIDAAINALDTAAEEPVDEPARIVAEEIDAAIASLDTAFEESVDEPTPIVAEEPESPTLDVAPVPEPETDAREEPPAGAETEPETDAEEEPPVGTEILTDLVERAVADRASAVHFTGSPQGLVVRARVDGSVTELRTFSDAEAAVAAAELALLTQTGRMTVIADEQPIELRATTVPTTLGPRTTLRVVPEEPPPPRFDDHFPEDVARVLRDAFEPLTGLVVICGSAAETRAAALDTTMRELVSPERIIFSIEDPVEHLVPGVEQTELDALAGVTHPAALQGILRSDSDVVVVGELLDPETARLAVRGARGRLVLTTLDAPTSSSAIRHLLDLGIAPWALTDAIVGIVGHAAVRRLCEACRESYYASDDELVELGRPLEERGRRLLGRSRGCHECGKTGYRDTVDLFEAFPVSIELSNVVARGASAWEIEQLAESAGMRTLRRNVVDLCLDGVTPTAELPRLGLSGTP